MTVKTTVFLEVSVGEYGGRVERLPFADLDGALSVLAAMEGKMGSRYSNDPEQARHRVDALDGAAVFEMGKVSSVRVIDRAAFKAATSWARKDEEDQHKDAAERQAKIIAEAIAAATRPRRRVKSAA